MAIYPFGTGTLWGVQNNITNPTPVKFGVLQGIDLSVEASAKPLFGQSQFPVAVGRGTGKITGKAKFAQISGLLLSQLFFGNATAVGQVTTANAESGTIPTTPYQVTVANSATFLTDLGVIYQATGLPLTRVASAPATGQYSVTAGVYTFAAADTTLSVYISYQYTVAATGQKIVIANGLIGTAPQFKIVLESLYGTGKANMTLNACVAEKLNLFSTKLEDFSIQELDFQAFADSSGNIGTFSMNEAS